MVAMKIHIEIDEVTERQVLRDFIQMALDNMGHIEFVFGIVGEKVGTLEKVGVPRQRIDPRASVAPHFRVEVKYIIP
jgi:hypothetical protein